MEKDEYLTWLEEQIKDEKSSSLYFKNNSTEAARRNVDIMLLVQHISKKDKNRITGFVDATDFALDEDFNIYDFTMKQKKGVLVKLTDSKGENHFFIKEGKTLSGKSQIFQFDRFLDVNDIKYLSDVISKDILYKDIEKVYDKLSRDPLHQRKNKFFKTVSDVKKEYSQEKLNNIGVGFEKEFKKAVTEASITQSPVDIAKTLYKNMNRQEKKDFHAAFATYTKEGFDTLLEKWKIEAVILKSKKDRKPTHKHELNFNR